MVKFAYMLELVSVRAKAVYEEQEGDPCRGIRCPGDNHSPTLTL